MSLRLTAAPSGYTNRMRFPDIFVSFFDVAVHIENPGEEEIQAQEKVALLFQDFV